MSTKPSFLALLLCLSPVVVVTTSTAQEPDTEASQPEAQEEPNASAAESLSPEDAIRRARAAANDGLRHHRVEEVVAPLEEEAVFTISNGIVARGKDRQRRIYTQVFEQTLDVQYERLTSTVEVAEDGVFAAEQGTWTGKWQTDAGPVAQRGTYFAMWRRGANGWRIRSEIYVKLGCDGEGCPKPAQGSDS